MKWAIVSAGPSASETWPTTRGDYDAVIAVNSVAVCPWLGPYDWWAAFDRVTCDRCGHAARPRCGILWSKEARVAVESGRFPLTMDCGGLEFVDWLDIADVPPMRRSYSVIYALQFARARGATIVHAFGCDWQGDTDVSGDVRCKRHDERWRRERDEFFYACGALATMGTTVTRITKGDHQ